MFACTSTCLHIERIEPKQSRLMSNVRLPILHCRARLDVRHHPPPRPAIRIAIHIEAECNNNERKIVFSFSWLASNSVSLHAHPLVGLLDNLAKKLVSLEIYCELVFCKSTRAHSGMSVYTLSQSLHSDCTVRLRQQYSTTECRLVMKPKKNQKKNVAANHRKFVGVKRHGPGKPMSSFLRCSLPL